MLRLADSYMTASFMRHLKGDTEAGKAFKSEEAGQFSRNRLPTSDKPPPGRALSPASRLQERISSSSSLEREARLLSFPERIFSARSFFAS